MNTSRRFHFVRGDLRLQWFDTTSVFVWIFVLAVPVLWWVDALTIPAGWCVLLVCAVAIGVNYGYDRRQESALWRQYETQRVSFEDGHLRTYDNDALIASESLSDVQRVRLYALRGRTFRLVAERPGPSCRIWVGLDDMDEFVAQFRRHAPQAHYEPMQNQGR